MRLLTRVCKTGGQFGYGLQYPWSQILAIVLSVTNIRTVYIGMAWVDSPELHELNKLKMSHISLAALSLAIEMHYDLMYNSHFLLHLLQ